MNEARARRLPGAELAAAHWASDEDGARAAAQQRLDASLARLAASRRRRARRGRRRRPAAGDGGRAAHVRRRRDRHLDPSRGPLALARARRRHGARERFDVPITHVVVDLEAEARRRSSRLPVSAGTATCRRSRRRSRRRRRSPPSSSESLKDGIAPMPFVTRSITSSFGRLRLVEVRADGAGRPRGRQRVAAAAAGLGEDRLAVGASPPLAAAGRRSAAGRPRRRLRPHRQRRDRRDVGRHGVGVVARDEVAGIPGARSAAPRPGRRSGRGRRTAIVASPSPSARDWRNASSRFGPIVPCRARVGERVAATPHFADEELLAGRRVAGARLGEARRCRSPSRRAPRARPRRQRRARAASLYGCGAGADGRLARRVDREDAVEPGDLEDLRDVAVAADERELAVVRAQPLDAADEHAERRRVDERRVR